MSLDSYESENDTDDEHPIDILDVMHLNDTEEEEDINNFDVLCANLTGYDIENHDLIYRVDVFQQLSSLPGLPIQKQG